MIARADAAARRFNPDARVRIRRGHGGIGTELADAPSDGDLTMEHPAGFTVFVEGGMSGIVDVEDPHDRLVLRGTGTDLG